MPRSRVLSRKLSRKLSSRSVVPVDARHERTVRACPHRIAAHFSQEAHQAASVPRQPDDRPALFV